MQRRHPAREHEQSLVQRAGQHRAAAGFQHAGNWSLRTGKIRQLWFPPAFVEFPQIAVDHRPGSAFARWDDRLVEVSFRGSLKTKGVGLAALQRGHLAVGANPELPSVCPKQQRFALG